MKKFSPADNLFPIFLAVWTVLFCCLRMLQHYSFQTNAYDLSIFDYMLSSTLKGGLMAEPFHGYWGTHLAIHFMPVLFLLLPFYALFKHPLFLVLLQVFVGTFSGLVLYRISKRFFPKGVLPALIAGVFLLYRPFQNGIMYDFHPEMFFPLFIFLSFYVLLFRKNSVLFFLAVTLALMTKEDLALYVVFFCLFLAIRFKEHRKVCLAAFVYALAYFLATMEFIIPYFRKTAGIKGQFEFFVLWRDLGGNVFEIFKTAVLKPRRWLDTVSWAVAGPKAFNLLASLLFIPFLTPWIVLVLPPVFILASSKSLIMQGFGLHYIAGILPFLFLALLHGLENLHQSLGRSKKGARSFATLMILLAAVNLANMRWNLLSPARYSALHDYRLVKSFIAEIPPGSSVASLSSLIPHIPKRQGIHMLPVSGDADYVLVHTGLNIWPMGRQEFSDLLKRLDSEGRYSRWREEDRIILYRKKQGTENGRSSRAR